MLIRMTLIKLILVRLVVVVSAGVVFALQWDSAMHKETYGSEAFNPGPIWKFFLSMIMSGIPAVFFAVCSYLILAHFAFRRGELDDFYARRRVKAVRRSIMGKREDLQRQNHVFDD